MLGGGGGGGAFTSVTATVCGASATADLSICGASATADVGRTLISPTSLSDDMFDRALKMLESLNSLPSEHGGLFVVIPTANVR